jgi:hypothetical protein
MVKVGGKTKNLLESRSLGEKTPFLAPEVGLGWGFGAEGGSRSPDQGLMSPLLYH